MKPRSLSEWPASFLIARAAHGADKKGTIPLLRIFAPISILPIKQTMKDMHPPRHSVLAALLAAFAQLSIYCPQPTHAAEVVGWGNNDYGQTTIPSGLSNVVALAAGGYHSLVLTADGRVVGWGDNSEGQTNIPSGLSNAVALAAGDYHSLALTADGRVVGWGANWSGQTAIPSGLSNVVALAAGWKHSLALTAEGRVVVWGDNSYGQTNIPNGLSNVVALAAGVVDSLALTADGRVVGWGQGDIAQTIPSGLSNVVALAAEYTHCLALTGLPGGVAPPRVLGPRMLVGTVDRGFYGRMIVANGAQAFGASGLPPGLTMDPGTGVVTGAPTAAGTYQVTLFATNVLGVGQASLTLQINLPLPGLAISGLVLAGLGSGFHSIGVVNADWAGATGLPAGLRIDAQTGLISGVPLETGDFAVSVLASNRYGMVGGSFTLRVSPVVGWGAGGSATLGYPNYGQTTIPSRLSNVVALAAGGPRR